MKIIGINFSENIVLLKTEGQNGTEKKDCCKEKMLKYIPSQYYENTCFSWDFEQETITINEDYVKSNPNAIVTEEDFKACKTISMPGLKGLYDNFIKDLEYEEVNFKEYVKESFPEFNFLFGE